MDAQKMIKKVQQQLNTMERPVVSEDIVDALNRAQINFTEETFDPDDRRREGFEENQRVTDELKSLIRKDNEISAYYAGDESGTEGSNAERIDLPTDLMYIVSHRSEIEFPADPDDININNSPTPPVREVDSSVDSKTKVVRNRVVQSDDVYKLLSDPFNKPRKSSPIADIHESYIDVYTDNTFIVLNILLNYVKQPQEIIFEGSGNSNNQDCELPDFVHYEIVNRASRLLLQSKSKTQTENAN